jgi:glycerophosphoryl diester phosphodiesterase
VIEHHGDGGGGLLRVGHKGADAIAPGNTLESFRAAAEHGVHVIELDVLRPRSDFERAKDWRRAPAGPAAWPGGPLVVAHDWADAARRETLTLAEALDAFAQPPLDEVTIDLDLKVAGREDEVARAIAERGLTGRAMVSTMEARSLRLLRDLAPELRRGLTLPRVLRDWTRSRLARPVVLAGMASLRARLPSVIERRAAELGLWSTWVYHPLVTPRAVAAAERAQVALVAWTVDDEARVDELVDMGVHGICSNDPRLLNALA